MPLMIVKGAYGPRSIPNFREIAQIAINLCAYFTKLLST